MATQIYVNLPVKSIQRSRAFFSRLGCAFDARFCSDTALCMVVGNNIQVMLLAERFFQTFTRKPVADARTCTELLLCLSCDSRAQVDDFAAKALSAGATVAVPPQDHGFMYARSIEDLDGHIWEWVYMDPDHVPSAAHPALPDAQGEGPLNGKRL